MSRVIFPDPEIWNRKDTPMTDNADYRRATALIRHHAIGDQAGITAILKESTAEDRGTQLLQALLGVFAIIQPLLRTEPARTAIRECIDITADDHDQPDWVRAAAAAIAAHADEDNTRLAEIVADFLDTGRGGGPLFEGIASIHFHLMPELRAPAGLQALSRWTARLARAEGEENQR